MKINWTPIAMQNLHAACDYLKKNKDAAASRKLRRAIFEKVENLLQFPALGKKEESAIHKDKEYRSLLHNNLKILYWIEGQDIYIIRIFDTRQNPDKLIF